MNIELLPDFHHFDPTHAARYGVNEAIVINHFVFWFNTNKANGNNFHDGKYWSYNSVEAMKAYWPYWTTSQIRRILASLVEQGILVTGHYNENKWDRSLWYAFTDEAISHFRGNRFVQNDKCHLLEPANHYTDNKTNKNIDASPKLELGVVVNESFDPKAYLTAKGVELEVATEWLAFRKKKKSAVTPLVMKRLEKEVIASGYTWQAAIEECCIRGWVFFKAEWVAGRGKVEPSDGLTAGERIKAKMLAEQGNVA